MSHSMPQPGESMNPPDSADPSQSGVSRRSVLGFGAAVAVGAPLVATGTNGAESAVGAGSVAFMSVRVMINGRLQPGKLLTGISVPRSAGGDRRGEAQWAARSSYLKVRDRQSYEFALASAAVAFELHGKTIARARIAVGGVATNPWRLPTIERALTGRPATVDTFESAVVDAADDAKPRTYKAFKPVLLQRTLVRVLTEPTAEATVNKHRDTGSTRPVRRRSATRTARRSGGRDA